MKSVFLQWKTIIVICFLTISANALFAQELTSSSATSLVKKNAAALNLSKNDLQNLRISNAYVDKISGASLVYVQQTYKGVDVFNAIQTYAFKNERLVSAAGSRLNTIDAIANVKAAKPAVEQKAQAAKKHHKKATKPAVEQKAQAAKKHHKKAVKHEAAKPAAQPAA